MASSISCQCSQRHATGVYTMGEAVFAEEYECPRIRLAAERFRIMHVNDVTEDYRNEDEVRRTTAANDASAVTGAFDAKVKKYAHTHVNIFYEGFLGPRGRLHGNSGQLERGQGLREVL